MPAGDRLQLGLKLDQAGLEFASVGIVRVFVRRDCGDVGAELRDMRALIGAGLTLRRIVGPVAPWFMDRAYADHYVGAIFANNRRLAAAIGSGSVLFARTVPSVAGQQGADAPFCALRLNDPSPEAYRG